MQLKGASATRSTVRTPFVALLHIDEGHMQTGGSGRFSRTLGKALHFHVQRRQENP
jgi:hypothetical protein